jgi:hypothetical protein
MPRAQRTEFVKKPAIVRDMKNVAIVFGLTRTHGLPHARGTLSYYVNDLVPLRLDMDN